MQAGVQSSKYKVGLAITVVIIIIRITIIVIIINIIIGEFGTVGKNP